MVLPFQRIKLGACRGQNDLNISPQLSQTSKQLRAHKRQSTMKSTLVASISLLGLTSARATPTDEPVRILPINWKFEITSLKGPGCPDFGLPDGNDRHTRLTSGYNTMDGSEIYYWVYRVSIFACGVGRDRIHLVRDRVTVHRVQGPGGGD